MTAHFPNVPTVRYEGPDTDNPFAYRHYDASRVVMGKTMEEHLRIAVCYWHTFAWDGSDVFGAGTFDRSWMADQDVRKAASARMDAAFEFLTKLGVPFYTFHDVDVVGTYETPHEYLDAMAWGIDRLEEKMSETGKRLLWGTANVFSHPRYMAGAATNPNPDITAWAALQVRTCLEATHRLGGANYVLWGGREGYDTILNTDLGQEMDQLGRFLTAVVEHKHKIGFEGDILIEPKPHEPTKHQYDRDTATVYGFLKRYGLENEVNVNIEPNHATLAGNSFEHEVATAVALGIFGSIDFNRGDAQNGWDTDQFPNDPREMATAMYYILKAGGFQNGGSNFDAKVRRQSIEVEDLFHAHIGGIDVLARALIDAESLISSRTLSDFVDHRYAGWRAGHGKQFLDGDIGLSDMADMAVDADQSPKPVSGRQEYLEREITRHIHR